MLPAAFALMFLGVQVVFSMMITAVLFGLVVFGDKVIPEHDKDRVHSTDRYRAKAVPKYSRINEPLPDMEWPTVLPVTSGP